MNDEALTIEDVREICEERGYVVLLLEDGKLLLTTQEAYTEVQKELTRRAVETVDKIWTPLPQPQCRPGAHQSMFEELLKDVAALKRATAGPIEGPVGDVLGRLKDVEKQADHLTDIISHMPAPVTYAHFKDRLAKVERQIEWSDSGGPDIGQTVNTHGQILNRHDKRLKELEEQAHIHDEEEASECPVCSHFEFGRYAVFCSHCGARLPPSEPDNNNQKPGNEPDIERLAEVAHLANMGEKSDLPHPWEHQPEIYQNLMRRIARAILEELKG